MLVGEIDKALGYFENWNSESPHICQVEWYRLGCFLSKGELDKAKELATKIASDPDHDFRDQAAAELRKFGKNE